MHLFKFILKFYFAIFQGSQTVLLSSSPCIAFLTTWNASTHRKLLNAAVDSRRQITDKYVFDFSYLIYRHRWCPLRVWRVGGRLNERALCSDDADTQWRHCLRHRRRHYAVQCCPHEVSIIIITIIIITRSSWLCRLWSCRVSQWLIQAADLRLRSVAMKWNAEFTKGG